MDGHTNVLVIDPNKMLLVVILACEVSRNGNISHAASEKTGHHNVDLVIIDRRDEGPKVVWTVQPLAVCWGENCSIVRIQCIE